MKVNTLVKYQLKDMKYVFIILYAILIFINIMNGSLLVIDGNATSNSGIDLSSSFTFFVVALCSFRETFGMWIQNGISRKNIFKGFLSGTIAISVICSIANYVISLPFSVLFKIKGYYSVITYVFEEYLKQCNVVVGFLIELLYMALIGAMCIMLGYFIAVLFYRAGKFMRIGIAAGLPITVFGVLPALITILYETDFYESKIVQTVMEFFLTVLGLKSGNPFYLIATTAVVLAILCVINYLLIRKTQVRTQS